MKNLLILISTFFIIQSFSSQVWTGNSNSDWNNSANWSVWPLDDESLVIDPLNLTGASASPIINANSIFVPTNIKIQNGAILNVQADLTILNDLILTGLNSNVVLNNSNLIMNPNSLILDSGAILNLVNGTINVISYSNISEEGTLYINGGNLNFGDTVFVKNGGQINQFSGVISTNSSVIFSDGNLSQNSSFNLNGGYCEILDDLKLENRIGSFEPTININGGQLFVSNVKWFGSLPGTGTPKFNIHGGLVNIGLQMENLPLSTVNMYLKLDQNGKIVFNGATIIASQITDSIIQMGNSVINLNFGGAFYNEGVFKATSGKVKVGGFSLHGNGSFQFDNIEINDASGLGLATLTPIYVLGNINPNSNGTITPYSSHVILNGTDFQDIGAFSNLLFHDLTISNLSIHGINFLGHVNVNGHLQLNIGKINTSSETLLIIKDNATSNEGNPLSFVNGPMIKYGNDPYVFPTGQNNRWRRISMSAPSEATSAFYAEYIHDSFDPITPVNSPLSAVSSFEHWDFYQWVYSAPVQIQIHWEDAIESNLLNCNNITLANWNGNSWDNVPSIVNGNCMLNGSGNIISTLPINANNSFTYGFFNNVTSQNIFICEGDSLMVGNNVYNTSGQYVDVLQDTNGNDSTIMSNVTLVIPDVSISSFAYNVWANDYFALEYQWVDCENDYLPLIGETNPEFEPSQNGNYALIINSHGCIDTSSCFTFNYLSNFEILKNSKSYSIYPNPTQNNIKIDFFNKTISKEFILKDGFDRILCHGVFNNKLNELNLEDFVSGIYYLYIENEIVKIIISK